MIAFDDFEATVRIPVKIVQGRPSFLYGGPLPTLRDGAVCQLTVSADAVEDSELRKRLLGSEVVEVLPAGSLLLVGIDPRETRHELQPVTATVHRTSHSLFVRVRLDAPLRMQVRATKHASLMGCDCTIVDLKRECGSLNEAYSDISRSYERWRRSTSGNVFKKIYCWREEEHRWEPLEMLRDRIQADFEQRLFRPQTELALSK